MPINISDRGAVGQGAALFSWVAVFCPRSAVNGKGYLSMAWHEYIFSKTIIAKIGMLWDIQKVRLQHTKLLAFPGGKLEVLPTWATQLLRTAMWDPGCAQLTVPEQPVAISVAAFLLDHIHRALQCSLPRVSCKDHLLTLGVMLAWSRAAKIELQQETEIKRKREAVTVNLNLAEVWVAVFQHKW